jgi:hypothetical protein
LFWPGGPDVSRSTTVLLLPAQQLLEAHDVALEARHVLVGDVVLRRLRPGVERVEQPVRERRVAIEVDHGALACKGDIGRARSRP